MSEIPPELDTEGRSLVEQQNFKDEYGRFPTPQELDEFMKGTFEEDSTDKKFPPSLFRKDEWEPYIGPKGGEGWKNPDTDEVVYQPEPPGDSEYQEFDGELEEGQVLAFTDPTTNDTNIEEIEVVETSTFDTTIEGPDGEEVDIPSQKLIDGVVAEREDSDNSGSISPGDDVATTYGWDITVDEVQEDGILTEGGSFYTFRDIEDSELEEIGITDEDETETVSVDLSEEEKQELGDKFDDARRGGDGDGFNKELMQDLRSYSVEALDEVREYTLDILHPQSVVESIRESEGEEEFRELYNEWVDDSDFEDDSSPDFTLVRELEYEFDDTDEVAEYLGEEYDVEYKEESFSSNLLDYMKYQKGEGEVHDVVDVHDEVESVVEKTFDKVSDTVDEDVEAFTMSNLDKIDYEDLDEGKSGSYRLNKIKLDPVFAELDGEEKTLLHELGHHFHNQVGLSSLGVERDNYEGDKFPDSPEWGYDESYVKDPLDVNLLDDIRGAWENYEDGNSQQLRKYQNRNVVEYVAISFRYAVDSPLKLKRRDPEIKDFWDTVFSGGQK